MIRRFGRETLSTYCQTLNGCVIGDECIKASSISIKCPLCGPFLVSRIGDAGWTESSFKCAWLYTHF